MESYENPLLKQEKFHPFCFTESNLGPLVYSSQEAVQSNGLSGTVLADDSFSHLGQINSCLQNTRIIGKVFNFTTSCPQQVTVLFVKDNEIREITHFAYCGF